MEFTRKSKYNNAVNNHVDERLNIFYIDYTCSFIIYNKIKINVVSVSLFTPSKGSFITDKYIIKYSNGLLNIYAMDNDRSLIDSFIFSKFTKTNQTRKNGVDGVNGVKGINGLSNNINTFNTDTNTDTDVNVSLFKKFMLKKNYLIFLYKDTSQIQFSKKEDYFIITEEIKKDNRIIKDKMMVVDVSGVGDDTLYKAVSSIDTPDEKINILCVNNGYGQYKKNSKWNGIPIGII